MKTEKPMFLSDAQLRSEIERCEYCEEKPCRDACPAHCSPADFMMAAKIGAPADFKRAAALIMGSNPLGGVCGAVCPDKHCMSACSRKTFDHAINIPAVQAAIVQKAKDLGVMPEFSGPEPNGKKVAVVGGGPAGLAAAAALAQLGYGVAIHEKEPIAGGMAALIPAFRLPKGVLESDVEWLTKLGDIAIKKAAVKEPASLLSKGFDAVVVAAGLDAPLQLKIEGEKLALGWQQYLREPGKHPMKGKRVAIIGGGAVAADCADTAAAAGAAHVELFTLEKLSELPLTPKELQGLLKAGATVTGRTRVLSITHKGGKVHGLELRKVELPAGVPFNPRSVQDAGGTDSSRHDFQAVVIAIGARPAFQPDRRKAVFIAGDVENGPTTVVEAAAAGKNAALAIDAFLRSKPAPKIEKRVKSRHVLAGRNLLPVPLEADFFGRKIASPFILSAAPPSDGYGQMKKAYEAGWAGGVMKTAFDNVPIHIPGEYMFAITQATYGNCDNVSGHPLDRVRREIGKLLQEFPDRLTLASTGGPVSGNDEADAKGWASNTKKLEEAGAMGIEYSLSCPQGGDGTKGDIVSQDAELTAKIIEWVLKAGSPDVPKLFKLTAAVTSIYPIIAAIKEVFKKYPNRKAGVTLANTFPTLSFRKGAKKEWEEGVVVGMSGQGVVPISNLTLANVARHGVFVSGNGGPMDYKAAADFLALGAKNVQFCTIVMKYGYGIIDDLHSGLSHLLAERGIHSVGELIGRALPNPITGFMELTAVKKISAVHRELCQHCGNCTRCPYQALSLDKDRVPETDPAKCIGCSICAQKCFSGALHMRERTKKETAVLQEA